MNQSCFVCSSWLNFSTKPQASVLLLSNSHHSYLTRSLPLSKIQLSSEDHRSRLKIITASAEREKLISPGTTTLLLRLEQTQVQPIRTWLRQWIREFLFNAEGTLSTPVSTDSNGVQSFLYFYASATSIRGVLSFAAEDEPNSDSVIIRLTSASRFINPSGSFSATLPGERRIVRKLFSSIRQDYDDRVTVLYKPPYIRLRKDTRYSHGNEAQKQHITVLVGEVRNVSAEASVIDYLRQWATELQFSAGIDIGLFRRARLPPISAEAVENGVLLKIEMGGNESRNMSSTKSVPEIIVKTKEKGVRRNIFVKNPEKSQVNEVSSKQSHKKRILILGSATHPGTDGTKIILKR